MKLNEWFKAPIEEKKKHVDDRLYLKRYFRKFKSHFELEEKERVTNKDYDDMIERYIKICDMELNVIVHLKTLSQEEIEERIRTKKDFKIDSSIEYKNIKDATSLDEIASLPSIYSIKYGPFNRHKDDKIHDLFYTCACEYTVGKYNLNSLCPKCKEKVEEKNFTAEIMGWIDLEGFRVPTHMGYVLLDAIIGNVVNRIYETRDYHDDKKLSASDYATFKKFKNSDLYDNIEEIFETFLSRREYESKELLIDFFLKHKDDLFTPYLPVLSTSFRRYVIGSSFNVMKFETSPLNTKYTELSENIRLLLYHRHNTNLNFKYYSVLYKEFRNFCEEDIFRDILTGAGSDGKCKEKFIRSNLTSGRQNNTVMAVIEPKWFLRPDMLGVSYIHLVALYSDRIKDYCSKTGVPYQTTMQILNLDIDKTDEHKEILYSFLKHNRCFAWFNRQPSVGLSSNSLLEIVELHDERIMKIHPVLCTHEQADFDGDAPSAKGLITTADIDIKAYFYMNMANYNRDYKGKFTGINLPINDMGILSKLSIPTSKVTDIDISLGFYHEAIYREDGSLDRTILRRREKKIKYVNTTDDYEEEIIDGVYIIG